MNWCWGWLACERRLCVGEAPLLGFCYLNSMGLFGGGFTGSEGEIRRMGAKCFYLLFLFFICFLNFRGR